MYRNEGGTFSKRPILTDKLSIPIEGDDFQFAFIGDVTGDGLSELLVRYDADRLRLYMVRRGRNEWTIHDQPLWERRINEDANIRFSVGSTPELLVIEEQQIFLESWE